MRFALLLLMLTVPAQAEDFVVLFTTGPGWDAAKAPADQAGFREHSANLKRLRTEGKITMGARYGSVGMIVLQAENEAAARAEFASDPSLAEKVFQLELHPLRYFYKPLCPEAEPQ